VTVGSGGAPKNERREREVREVSLKQDRAEQAVVIAAAAALVVAAMRLRWVEPKAIHSEVRASHEVKAMEREVLRR
jgi:hypothetical protein